MPSHIVTNDTPISVEPESVNFNIAEFMRITVFHIYSVIMFGGDVIGQKEARRRVFVRQRKYLLIEVIAMRMACKNRRIFIFIYFI